MISASLCFGEPVVSSASGQVESRCRSFIANREDDHLFPMMLAHSAGWISPELLRRISHPHVERGVQ